MTEEIKPVEVKDISKVTDTQAEAMQSMAERIKALEEQLKQKEEAIKLQPTAYVPELVINPVEHTEPTHELEMQEFINILDANRDHNTMHLIYNRANDFNSDVWCFDFLRTYGKKYHIDLNTTTSDHYYRIKADVIKQMNRSGIFI